jgi:sugar/nucleoside kinase (ribokinase family)
VGRTGRGDTTFAAYLARRNDHGVSESLKFAAALVSIKMETPGPFQGSLADVLARMNR